MGKGAKAIVGIIILAVIIGGAYAIFHKPASSNNSSTNSGTYGGSNTGSQKSSTGTAASGGVVQTKTDSSIGQYLATPAGLPLYTYKLDTTGVSNCTGSCLSNWPAYIATSSVTNLPANVGTITRTDTHAVQYTYKGMPLYTFTGDSAGKVTGDGLENFAVAKP